MNQNTPATLLNDTFRSVFTFIDRPCFWLLGLMYKIFFNVASADIFSSGTISSFYRRVQLIIGVFMLFQLTITIVKGIINPEEMTDGKGGKNNVIYRVLVSLFMLVAIMPINIPGARNEYQIQLNNNGLLFGTLYSLQNRILSNNTIGRLVLGTNSVSSTSTTSTTASASNSTEENLEKSANIFTTTVLKGFIRINLKDGDLKDPGEGKEPEVLNENRMCTDIDDATLKIYTKLDSDPGDILDLVNASCTSAKSASWFGESLLNKALGFVKRASKTDRYVFAYIPILPAVTALIFAIILLSFSIDVAVRAIKLAMLRLIAPIPILSYMDPKGSKDGAFSSWVKALTSTYLELFVRLALVYFVIYLIQDLIVHGLVINTGGGVVGVLSFILICIGLFVFAKQAPKFLREVLGLKGEGTGLFSGLGAVAGAASGIGSARVSARASRDADIARATARAKAAGMSDQEAEKYANAYAGSLGNRGKHLLAGMAGGLVGAGTGMSAAAGAKDHQVKAALDAAAKRNAKVAAAGRDGGTFFGGLGAYGQRALTGETQADALETDFKRRAAQTKNEQTALKARQDALKTEQANNAHRKSIMDRAKSKASDSDKTTGTYRGITANYRDYHSAYTAAVNNGTGVHTQYRGADGSTITKAEFEGMSAAQQAQYVQESWFDYNGQRINMAEAQSIDMGLLDENQADYYNQVVAGTIDDNSITADRAAYREATGQDLEDHFGGDDGIKASFGSHANANSAESDAISRVSQDLSERSQQISEDRRAYPAERAAANANRFDGK